MTDQSFVYKPGVCNMDSAGVSVRRKLAYLCLIAGSLCLAVVYYFDLGIGFRVVVGFTTGYTSALNFLQAKNQFCVFNASKRTFETDLKKSKIINDLYRDVDRKKMRGIVGRSLIYAFVGALVGLLPL